MIRKANRQQSGIPNIQNQNTGYHPPVIMVYACGVCLQPIIPEHNATINQGIYSQMALQCGHLFHYQCIANTLQIRNACPLCNVEMNQNQSLIPSSSKNNNDNNDYNSAQVLSI